MNLLRPRSLSALVLLGLAIIALPLVAALVTAGVQMRWLAETSERIIADGVVATRLTRDLFAQTSSLERQMNVYRALLDQRLLESYATLDARLRQTESQLAEQLRDTEVSKSLGEFSQLRQAISAQMLGAATRPPDYERLQADFVRMQQVTGTLSSATNSQIDAEVASLRERTQHTQQLMFWGFVLLIPLTAGAILLFSLRVGRPLGQIDRAISELGGGALHRAIAVQGPADLERLGRQLEWLRVRLLELAQERNRFLRHMSHELKTPLANIREGTELLMDGAVGELDSAQREVTTILRDNGIKLQQLIENLLEFSAWQARHAGLEISEFRLRPLIKSALETHQLTLLAQRVHLDLKVQDIELHADRAKLKLILDNLLSNALKYSPRGGTIFIHAQADKEQLLLDVADTGPGISRDERSAIFDAFYSGRAPTAGHLKGTGIGLSVVSEFVQAHGGSVEILDGVFPGAHFRIRLPLAPQLEVEPA